MWNNLKTRIVRGVSIGVTSVARVFAKGGREYKWESKHRCRTKVFMLAILAPLFVLNCIADSRVCERMARYLREVP